MYRILLGVNIFEIVGNVSAVPAISIPKFLTAYLVRADIQIRQLSHNPVSIGDFRVVSPTRVHLATRC